MDRGAWRAAVQGSRLSTHAAAAVYSLSRVCLSVTPWTVAHQAPLSMGFSKQVYRSELPFPSPEILPTQERNPCPALAGGFFTTEPLEALYWCLRGSHCGRNGDAEADWERQGYLLSRPLHFSGGHIKQMHRHATWQMLSALRKDLQGLRCAISRQKLGSAALLQADLKEGWRGGGPRPGGSVFKAEGLEVRSCVCRAEDLQWDLNSVTSGRGRRKGSQRHGHGTACVFSP